jgi:DNA gyrase subunit A
MATTDIDLVVATIRRAPRHRGREPHEAPAARPRRVLRRAGRPEDEIEAAEAKGDYFLSERQAKAILEMRLSRLTGLEREKLAAEYGELCGRSIACARSSPSPKLLMT